MIRVGMMGDDFVLILAGPKWPNVPLKLTPLEAADLSQQIKALLPDELLNLEPFSSDNFPATSAASKDGSPTGTKLE